MEQGIWEILLDFSASSRSICRHLSFLLNQSSSVKLDTNSICSTVITWTVITLNFWIEKQLEIMHI